MTEAWTKTQTKHLIHLYREYPDLYNPYHPNYLRKNKRNELLLKLQHQLEGVKPGVSVQDIKAKIKTLQNQLTKERNRMQAFVASERGRDEEYKARLWCYDDLQFLKPAWYETNGSPKTAVKEVTEADSQMISEESQEESVNELPYDDDDSYRTPETISELLKITEKCLGASEALMAVRNGMKSKSEIFCEYLCSELEEIQLDETLDDVIIEVLKSLYDAKKKERTNS